MLTINVFLRLCHLEPCVRDPSSLCSVGMTKRDFRNPHGTNYIGATCDLLLLALSIKEALHVKLTTLPCRTPRGMYYVHPARD